MGLRFSVRCLGGNSLGKRHLSRPEEGEVRCSSVWKRETKMERIVSAEALRWECAWHGPEASKTSVRWRGENAGSAEAALRLCTSLQGKGESKLLIKYLLERDLKKLLS